MRQNILLAALSALTVATAQTTNFTINPGTVKPSIRSDWCNAEYNTCGKLCGGNPTANDCDVNTLDFVCTCSNGSAPGLQYYIQSMPTFICEQAYSDCIAANTASSRAQDECRTNIKSKCGTLDPAKAQLSDPSATTAESSSATKPAATSASQAAASSTSKGAAPTNAAMLGNGVAMVAAGVFAALL